MVTKGTSTVRRSKSMNTRTKRYHQGKALASISCCLTSRGTSWSLCETGYRVRRTTDPIQLGSSYIVMVLLAGDAGDWNYLLWLGGSNLKALGDTGYRSHASVQGLPPSLTSFWGGVSNWRGQLRLQLHIALFIQIHLYYCPRQDISVATAWKINRWMRSGVSLLSWGLTEWLSSLENTHSAGPDSSGIHMSPKSWVPAAPKYLQKY